MVVMEYFSRWIEVVPIPNQEAVIVAEAFKKHVSARHGGPLELHSDQGRIFKSELWQEIMNTLNVKNTRIIVLYPQSEVKIESMNVYRIQLNSRNKPLVVHVERFAKYRRPDSLKWLHVENSDDMLSNVILSTRTITYLTQTR